jgi:hypothetical protein
VIKSLVGQVQKLEEKEERLYTHLKKWGNFGDLEKDTAEIVNSIIDGQEYQFTIFGPSFHE